MSIEIPDIKGPVCIIPVNGMGLLMYEVLTANGADVACVCDSAFYEDFAEREDFNSGFKKYKLKNAQEAFKDYPDASYVVAANFFKSDICNLLERHNIKKIFYPEQILNREHTAFVEMLPQKGYNGSDFKNYRAQAMIDARKCFLRPREKVGGLINKLHLFFDDKYTLRYQAENDDVLCDAREYDTVDGLIKACIPLLDQYKFAGEILIRYSGERHHDDLKKFMRYLNSKNEAIGYIAIMDANICVEDLKLLESKLLLEFNNMLLLAGTYEPLNGTETYLTLPPICMDNRTPYDKANDELKAVFIHIPKNAGSAFSKALLHTEGHLSALNLLRADSKKFHEYFKFAIVRNPWDRLLSIFFYSCEKGLEVSGDTETEKKNNFKKFVLELDITNIKFLKPQYIWLCDEKGNLIVDYVGRFEKLQESYEYIGKRLGLDISKPLPTINASKHGPYQEYYDEETIEIVRKLYRKDIELFGYEFE